MCKKYADRVNKVGASSAPNVQAMCTNCAHSVALLNPPLTDKRIFFRNKSFYTTFRCNYFVKNGIYCHYCHLLPPPEAL